MVASGPDVPQLLQTAIEDNAVNVSWRATHSDVDPVNPGSQFYVEYRLLSEYTHASRKNTLLLGQLPFELFRPVQTRVSVSLSGFTQMYSFQGKLIENN